MQFVPLWTDIIERPNWKILDLPPDLFRMWVLCLIAAQRHDYIDGRLPDTRTLAHWLGMGRIEAEGLLDRLVAAGLTDAGEDGHQIHDWDDWRDLKDPGATRRQRSHRAKKQAEKATSCGTSRGCHGAVTPVSPDVTHHHTSDSIQHSPSTAPDAADEIIAFGREAAPERFELEAVPDKVRGWIAAKYPDDWIRDAILVANCNASPGGMPAYINVCLRKWKKRGGPDPEEVARARPTREPELKFTVAPPSWKGAKPA